MPRQPRIDVPGIPQHIVQRGNDRQPTCFADADRVRYLTELNGITLRVGCHVHAYVRMTNHVHLLVTPTELGQIAHVMESQAQPGSECTFSYGKPGSECTFPTAVRA